MLFQDKIVEIYMFCTLSHLGILKVQGKDAKKFLQGQLTCDVEKPASMGAHCTPQGRVVSLFYLFSIEDAYYLLMQKNMISIAMAALKKYAVFFKTELSDASAEMFVLGASQNLAPEFTFSIPLSPTSSRHFLIGKEQNRAQVWAELNKLSSAIEAEQWHLQNIEEEIPAIYPQTSGKFLPHELNLDKLNAIHFDKGCYTGQEIIARMHYKGKLKTRLRKAIITSPTPLEVGLDICTQQENTSMTCGMIVDLCKENATSHYDLLIALNESNNNTAFFVNDNLLTISEQKHV